MKKFLILGHLGLGDQFLMNGLVHFLRKTQDPQTILVVCKTPMKPTLDKLYSDWSTTIQTLPVNDDNMISPLFGANPAVLQSYEDQGFQIVRCGVHTGSNLYKSLHPSCWANGFYMQYGIPYWIRYSEFCLPQQNPESQSLHQTITQQIGPNYILLHDDPERGLILPYDEIKDIIQHHKWTTLPILYLGKDRYKHSLIPNTNNPILEPLSNVETVLDYCTLLYNATACFMMDSSLAILLDLLQPPTNQYRKSYSRYKAFPTQGLYQSIWHYSDAVAK
jgi:hypothetical protein